MILIFKWLIVVFVVFLIQQLFTIKGINFNLSFLLVYLFAIHYCSHKTEQKKIVPSELLSILFFVTVGLVEDLFQGIIGAAIISKTITGILLIILVKQSLFHWTEPFKALVIFIFTIIDEAIYTSIMVYFFNFNIKYGLIFKVFLIQGLINIPFGLILSRRKL